MKKFLSMVLALVMTMSLVTISAGATFTDDSKITYTEAVDVMSTVEVVGGYADGNFNPTNTLTRGAAAKIICNMVLGPTTAGALTANAASFKDVPVDHVFAGYIAYCSQQGIINGYSDGTFRPANTLTGYQFMKMLLGALGYDGSREGFTGANWTINVAKLALGAGLNDGLKEAFVGSKAVTREEACLYALNTLQATMVQYDSTANIIIGDAQISLGSKAENVPQTGYKDIYENDKVVANQTLQFGEKYFPKLKLDKDADALGRKANVWTYKNAEVGTYTTEDALLVYTADMSSTSGKSEISKALKGYDLDGAVVYRNGYPVNLTSHPASGKDEAYVTIDGTSVADIAEYTGNGILVEIYADGTDVTDVVVIDSYLGKVTKVNKTDETITIELKLSNADTTNITTSEGYDTFEKDEYVMVSPVYNSSMNISKDSGNMDDAVVVAAEKATGKVTSVSGTKVALDGTSYKVAEINAYSQPSLKDNIDVYLDAYGYAVYTSNVAAKDFVYAVTTYSNTDKYGNKVDYFQGVKTDGTVVEYKLNDDSDGVVAGELYSYSISSSKIKLTAADVATADNDAYVTYFGNGKSDGNGTGKIESGTKRLGYRYFTDETVFISVSGIEDDLKVTVGTGKQLVKDEAAKYAIVSVAEKESDASADIAVVFVNSKSVTNVKDLVMAADDSANGYKTVDDVDYNTYEVYINGEKQTIAVDEDESDEVVKGQLYTYGVSKDVYTLSRISSSEDVVENTTATEIYKNLLTVGGYGSALDATDAKIVDLTDNGIEDMGALKDLVDVAGTAVIVTVVYNSDDEALYIYVIDAMVEFTKAESTYTLNEDFEVENLSTISYKENGKTLVVNDNEFTAEEFKSVKVSTIDGQTFTGYIVE